MLTLAISFIFMSLGKLGIQLAAPFEVVKTFKGSRNGPPLETKGSEKAAWRRKIPPLVFHYEAFSSGIIASRCPQPSVRQA